MNTKSRKIDTIVYAARLKDRERLKRSSSGGAFVAISDAFLDNGNAVVSAVYNYENSQTESCLYTDKGTRDQAIGSKYMQSIPGDIFRDATEWLKKNPEKNLLFTGMGCQAAGFLKFAEFNGIADRVTVVDIICHGSPSPMLWKDYAGALADKGKIEYITFKDKRNGWKHPTAVAVVDGEELPMSDYVKLFYNRCALRPACHKCPYAAVERNTDMTIGDYWGIDEVMPDFYDEGGNSLILIHTQKGMELFEAAKKDMDYRESNTTDCLQPNLRQPTEVSENRERFWMEYTKNGINYILKKYTTISMQSKVKNKLKKLIGGGYEELSNRDARTVLLVVNLSYETLLAERSAA